VNLKQEDGSVKKLGLKGHSSEDIYLSGTGRRRN
jgi:hypothetical protein